MKLRRSRARHEKTFKERLLEQAHVWKVEAARIPHGTARELLLRRARQAETASHLDEWLSSPELQAPR